MKIKKKQEILIEMEKIYNNDNTKCWEEYGAMGSLIYCRWEYKMVHSFCKTVW